MKRAIYFIFVAFLTSCGGDDECGETTCGDRYDLESYTTSQSIEAGVDERDYLFKAEKEGSPSVTVFCQSKGDSTCDDETHPVSDLPGNMFVKVVSDQEYPASGGTITLKMTQDGATYDVELSLTGIRAVDAAGKEIAFEDFSITENVTREFLEEGEGEF